MAIPPLKPQRTIEGVKARLAKEEDPVVRRNLETVLRHQQAELDGDVDAIMATLIAEPEFRFHGLMDASGNIISRAVQGQQGVRAMYQSAIATKATLYQEFNAQVVVADRWSAAYSGWLRLPMDGRGLRAMGYDADPDAYYINEGMHWTFWTFDENGLGIGEDIGFDARSFMGILDRRIELN